MAPAAIKAHVIVGALPFISHFIPMHTISKSLLAQGYQVSFITGEVYREDVEQTGARCIVPAGWETLSDESAPQISSRSTTLSFAERENWNVTELFIRHIPAQFEAIQTVLASTMEESAKPTILLFESSFLGGLPLKLGAPGLQPKGVLTVGILPVLATSIYTAPPGSGILPDNSDEGQRRNKSLNKAYVESFGPSQAELNKVLSQLGARTTDLYRHDATIELSDRFLQLCSPSLEYPRDLPPSFVFTGGLPRSESKSRPLPAWWSEVVLNKGKKHIVAVSQGTVIRNHDSLIVPTLKALANRSDMFILVALGKHGASLPPTVLVPENARIADWIPFDELFKVSDVFITNGGYGSFQNALAHGVPLVIAAPSFADKTDIADRVEWSGAGINLKTGTPSEEDLATAVVEVLTTVKYQKRALEIQSEIKSHDSMALITAAIDEVANS